MLVRFLRIAEAELNDVIAYYNDEREALGLHHIVDRHGKGDASLYRKAMRPLYFQPLDFARDVERDRFAALAAIGEPDLCGAATAQPANQHKPGAEFEPGSQHLPAARHSSWRWS